MGGLDARRRLTWTPNLRFVLPSTQRATRAMSLPRTGDEAALRALDRQCAKPDSVASRRTVSQLAVQSLAYKESFLLSSATWGLGNLVRCALEAQVSVNTTTNDASNCLPVLLVAAGYGAVPALKALLAGGASIELTDKRGITALAAAATWTPVLLAAASRRRGERKHARLAGKYSADECSGAKARGMCACAPARLGSVPHK